MKKVCLHLAWIGLVCCILAGQAQALPEYGSSCDAPGCHGSASNTAPTPAAGPDQTVTAGQTVTLDGSSSSDAEGDELVYSWAQTGGTAVQLQNAHAAITRFTAPATGGSEALAFTLTVTDTSGASAADTCIVNVTSANQAPTANAGLDQTVAAGANATLSGRNSVDPDGTIAGYAWKQVSGAAVTLSAPKAAETTFTAPASPDGQPLVFELQVTDNEGLSSTDRVTVNVAAAPTGNAAPTADAGPDQNVGGGEQVALSGLNSADADGEVVSYAWVQVSGTPVQFTDPNLEETAFVAPAAADEPQVLVFRLTVTDDAGLAASDECAVTVAPAASTGDNEPPSADAGPDQSVAPGALVSLDGSASTDPENDIAAYEWIQTGGPDVTLSAPDQASCDFTAPTPVNGTASLTFELRVTDGDGQVDTDVVAVNVRSTNSTGQAPIADAGPDQSAKARRVVTLDGSGSGDPDGQTLAYAWKQVAGRPVLLSDPRAAKVQFFTPMAAGRCPLVFQLTVTDADGLRATDRVVVTLEKDKGRAFKRKPHRFRLTGGQRDDG